MAGERSRRRRPGDSVDGQMRQALKADDRGSHVSPVAAVEGARRKPVPREPKLHSGNVPAHVAGLHGTRPERMAPEPPELSAHPWTGDPVKRQPVPPLEPD